MDSIEPRMLKRLESIKAFSHSGEFSDYDAQQSFASSSVSREDGFDSKFWVKDDQCKICAKKFSKLKGVMRHHCRFCGSSVCDGHSLKRRDHPELYRSVRICDMCEKAIVGHDVKQEMQLEVSKRLGQLDSLKEEVQRRATEETEKEQQITHLRVKLEEDKKVASRKSDSLTERMIEEQSRNQRAQSIITSLETALTEENYSEKLASEKHSKSIAELESWKGDVEQFHQDIKELDDRVDASFFKIKYRIPLSVVSKVLCDDCQTRSFHTSFKESVLLSNQSSMMHKPEKSGCALM